MNKIALQDINDAAARGLSILVVSRKQRQTRLPLEAFLREFADRADVIRVSRAVGDESIRYASGGQVRFTSRGRGRGYSADKVYLDWEGAADDADAITWFAPTIATSTQGQVICSA